MPFRTFDQNGNLIDKKKLTDWLIDIKNRGFKGVTSDFWWKIVEPNPKKYNFGPYIELANEIEKMGLKLKVILSFHSCGNTIGDECNFPLPTWVLDTGNDIFYQDQNGNINKEYISIFADDSQLSDGRLVLEAYNDLITQFHLEFEKYYGDLIINIELGAGPAGQLHYPSYSYDKAFCGIGFFQWYGSKASEKFNEFLKNIKFSDDSQKIIEKYLKMPSPTLNEVYYKPYQEYFFSELNIGNEKCNIFENKDDCGDLTTTQVQCESKGCCWKEIPDQPYCYYSKEVYNYKADFGLIYMHWYQEEQLKHLQKLLTIGRKVLGFGVPISLKLPCVHWFVNSDSRAAEKTSGFVINYEEQLNFDVIFLFFLN